MRPLIKRTLWIISLIVALVFLGWYRSLVDNVDFLHSFDGVLNRFVTEIWKVITNPIVLTSIVILVSLQYFKGYLPNIIPWISELKIGEVSAKFSELKFTEESSGKKDARQSYIDDHALIEKIVANLSLDTCWIISRLADRALSIPEVAEIVANEIQSHRGKIFQDRKDVENMSYGFIVAMNSILKDTLFTYEKFEEYGQATDSKVMLKLSGYAKKQIFARIVSFEQQ